MIYRSGSGSELPQRRQIRFETLLVCMVVTLLAIAIAGCGRSKVVAQDNVEMVVEVTREVVIVVTSTPLPPVKTSQTMGSKSRGFDTQAQTEAIMLPTATQDEVRISPSEAINVVPLELPSSTSKDSYGDARDKPHVVQAANLREGPGTNYPIVGSLTAGDEPNISGRNEVGDWFEILVAPQDTAWIASFLVEGAPNPVNIPLASHIPPPPEPEPKVAIVAEQPSAQPVSQEPEADGSIITREDVLSAWQDSIDVGKTMVCEHFEYKVYDLRRVKSVWFYSKEYIAQGEFLLVFVEVKNISSGTSYFAQFDPYVGTLEPDVGVDIAKSSTSGGSYAQWMYQTGDFYEDVNPGQVIGLVEAYDLPSNSELLLLFGMDECPDNDTLSLGLWSNVQRGHAN